MNDPTFRGRVKVAALQYAQYIHLQAGVPNSKTQWAQRTMQQPDATAQILVPTVVMNPNVQQAGGAAINDTDLIAAVQSVADMMM
jgi:hypothetical protein